MDNNLSLTVRVGGSLDSLVPIQVNDDAHPGRIQTDKFDGYITVRIRDHPTLPSHYFDNNNDLFCIQISGRFLLPHCTINDIQFGNQFERPLHLPMGSSLLLKFATFWDPGLEADLYTPQPYAFSPLIITMNQIKVEEQENNDPKKDKENFWSSPQGEPIQEDITTLSMDLKTPEDRRAFYKYPQNRKAVDLTPNQIWHMQFSNPYINFNKCTIRVPGFEMDVLKYWDGQPLRYYCKTLSDEVLFIIEFDLRRLS
ncbi:hypothetical protein BDA99DRAFT_601077 [Phascolomyces articulosus]|uniref:Domain of unknown function at the cortex 1 domain-containing protein n=1 Tax=Phascolomyces articulosus TaxID=60185 RepID=A0AAD5K9B9_9FUNG|nr:hypothetical protein BDA99DRAFT_601077 [Phascolomyces articulosus]